ncbi:MAG TPA: hypothetical protein VHR16_05910 [Candidatus Limnocylindrales bacterium]|nr:hypothetical protein [Candidatus Limnocylindrales bacterium]
MELFVGIGLVIVAAIFFLWRSRRGTSNDLEAQTKGLPDDLRDKSSGQISLPNRGRPWSGRN